MTVNNFESIILTLNFLKGQEARAVYKVRVLCYIEFSKKENQLLLIFERKGPLRKHDAITGLHHDPVPHFVIILPRNQQ